MAARPLFVFFPQAKQAYEAFMGVLVGFDTEACSDRMLAFRFG